jgi:DNA-binding MarR family transcriptional regulator
MGRGFEYDERAFGDREPQAESQARMPLSQGRGGGSGDAEDRRRKPPEEALSELRTIIDQAAEDKPTVSEFLDRLERQDVTPVASIQANGRWNGMVYEFRHVRVKGSQLGRPYTAKGLQERRGVRYDPARDAERLGRASIDPATVRPSRDRQDTEFDRSTRSRGADRMTPAERTLLNDVGRFRTVALRDLEHARYPGHASLLERDVKRLVAEGLLERRTIATDARGKTATFLALTRRGKSLLKRSDRDQTGDPQALYSGFVKPREIVHDAGVYRMYLAETERIEREGGRIQRLVLDYELKKRAYSPLAKAHDLPPLEYAERQQEIAKENGLHVVDGHLVLPDLRVEYEDAQGAARHVDLELATQNYRAAHIRSKAAAGFKVYADTRSGHLSAVLDDHDLIAELLRS